MTTTLNPFVRSAQPSQSLARRSNLHQIALVDAAVVDHQLLLTEVEQAEVFILKANSDGIEQITRILKNRHELSAIHLIAQGTPGSIQLGNSFLAVETVERYAWDLQIWADALRLDAALLIYSSEATQGERGESLLYQLSELTQLRIAAPKNQLGKSGSLN